VHSEGTIAITDCRNAKCRYWPIASFRGSAAIGRFGGYSQAHDAYFGLGEMYIGGTNSPDWIFHGMSLRVFAPFCGELRKGNTSTRRESACLQTKRWWAL
jgi:hypothetical protein